jgi:hypothetical protein
MVAVVILYRIKRQKDSHHIFVCFVWKGRFPALYFPALTATKQVTIFIIYPLTNDKLSRLQWPAAGFFVYNNFIRRSNSASSRIRIYKA